MTDDEKIKIFMGRLQSEGRSSPSGHNWARFHSYLCKHQTQDSGRPLMPLILAAAGESDATKHLRLRAQLEWTASQGKLCEAIEWLNDLKLEGWNVGSSETWHLTSYP